jgi:tRNA(Ile)-lysidine synthase
MARRGHRSLEDAGRRARYAFFERVVRERGSDRVAVGHTADDQAETVLLGILRGGGLDALAGMPRARPLSRAPGAPWLVRPLLGVWRAEILAYCERFGVPFVEDASNRSRAFTRNRIRHDLLPLLEKEYNPQVRRHLARLAELAREVADLHRELAAELLAQARVPGTEPLALDLTILRSRPPALVAAALRLAFVEATGGELALDAAATARALAMLGTGGPCAVDLLGGWRAEVIPGLKSASRAATLSPGLKSRAAVTKPACAGWPVPESAKADLVASDLNFNPGQGLIFRRGAEPAPRRIAPRPLPVPGRVELTELGLYLEAENAALPDPWTYDPSVAYLDAAAVAGDLQVRSPERGDRFQPLGLKGTRKLSDFLIDRKVPRAARSAVPLVVDAEKILWVAGMRLDERARLPAGGMQAIRLVLGRLRP